MKGGKVPFFKKKQNLILPLIEIDQKKLYYRQL